jgi:hypothetical protein
MIKGKRLILTVKYWALSSRHSANAEPMPISEEITFRQKQNQHSADEYALSWAKC